MDPITMALVLGASAGVKSIGETAIKDIYAGLKSLIQRKYATVKVEQLEVDPSSRNRRGVIEEELAAAGADKDREVLQKAQELLETSQRLPPAAVAAIGVDLKDIEGASLAIRRVTAEGPGVEIIKGKFSGDVTIEDIKAGGSGERPPKAQ
jgi:hypothetical protein